MGKKIYLLRTSISLFFLGLALIIDSHKLSAFIIWLNIKKFRNIKFKSKSKKKILIFSKSNGDQDLSESFRNQNNNEIIFYWIPRSFLKKIFSRYFKDDRKLDYFTKPNDSHDLYKKKLYVQFLTSTFNSLNYFLKLDGFISFNIFYYAEKPFDEVCKNLNKKFIILHKESVLTPIEDYYFAKVYKKYNDKSLSYKISTYSENHKQMLIKSKIATKKQVIVNGCPRSDYSFRLRKIKPENKLVVFYLIVEKRMKSKKFVRIMEKSNTYWGKLNDQTLKYLIEYTKINSDIKIILKGKTGVHEKYQLISKSLPENFTFIDGGSGEKFLKDAKIIIAFNSTVVLEAIASNRNLIIPNFNNENKRKKNLMLKIDDKKYFTSSKKQFNKKLDLYLNSKYKNRKISNTDKKTLKYYLGNTDGESGKKMQNFLKKVIN